MGALDLSVYGVNSISTCWNDAFRQIYCMNRWESVSITQYFTSELPFRYILDILKWNFVCKKDGWSNRVLQLKHVLDVKYDVASIFGVKYMYNGASVSKRKRAVCKYFKLQCRLDLILT
jgi:hypothetical protein